MRSDMSTIEHAKDIWTEGPTHNTGTQKRPISQCGITGGNKDDPLVPNAKPMQVLICG